VSERGPFGVGSAEERPRTPAPPRPRPPAGRSSTTTWLLGVLVVGIIAYITLNTLRTDAPGSRGVPNGSPLPRFAAPLALSDLEGDANLSKQACGVRGPRVVNSCQLAERGPVVLAFFALRSKRCDEQLDALDALRVKYPGVGFAAVAIRGDRGDLRKAIRSHGWKLPVAYDHDGAVANAYAVAICPTVTFAKRGGTVVSTSFGLVKGAALERRIEALRP
jgi:peroxiredoxin